MSQQQQSEEGMMTTTTFEVYLAVYDLSRGMARTLSSQFLGPDHALDVIPHTGLVVYGREYFFGGGIQSEDPILFRQSMGIQPFAQQLLGRTTVTKRQFDDWCSQCMARGRFTMDSYDLLERNCNNFCHEAAVEGLGLPDGIPPWILDVPRRFLASPMGMMIRPMLEQMQITGNGGSGASTSSAGGTSGSSIAPFDVSTTAAATSTPATSAASAAGSNVNPWAHLPSSSSADSNNTSTARQEQPANEEERQVRNVSATVPTPTPTLDSYTKPLLSNDTKTATLCAKKLIATATTDHDKIVLKEIGDALVCANNVNNGSTNLQKHQQSSSSSSLLTEELIEASSKAILSQLAVGQNVTFALMLFRLVVLHPPLPPKNSNSSNNNINESNSSYFSQCLDWIQQQLLHQTSSSSTATTTTDSSFLSSPAAQSMAWCTLSNARGASLSSLSVTTSSCTLEELVHVAIANLLSTTTPTTTLPVRQAAAAFLYNVSLTMESLQTKEQQQQDDDDGDEQILSDMQVSLLCASLDGISLEQDDTCRLRRLLVAANIVKPKHRGSGSSSDDEVSVAAVTNGAAKNLVHDLGFADALDEIVVSCGVRGTSNSSAAGSGDAKRTVQAVATELLSILQS